MFALLIPLSAYANDESLETSQKSEVYLATIPKSGTHLMQKTMKLLNVELSYALEPGTNNSQPHLTHYLRLKNLDDLENVFSSKNKYIVTIRDPRDFMVSYVNWVMREQDRKVLPEWKALPMEKKLSQLISGKIPPKIDKFLWRDWHMENFFIARELMNRNLDNVLVLRFEDLVGTKGGGSDEKQYECLEKINLFLNLNYSKEQLDQICSSIWGGTGTFSNKKKKVGQWADLFKLKHISAFKKKYNNLLIDLGYESEPNW